MALAAQRNYFHSLLIGLTSILVSIYVIYQSHTVYSYPAVKSRICPHGNRVCPAGTLHEGSY